MNGPDLTIVKSKGSVRTHIEKQTLIDSIIKIIQGIGNLHKIKNDIEFLRYIMELITNGASSKLKEKIDVKEVAFEIFTTLFPSSNPEERDMVKKSIDFLVENDQVKKISTYQKLSKGLVKYFLKGL